jgi:hypothetical protein
MYVNFVGYVAQLVKDSRSRCTNSISRAPSPLAGRLHQKFFQRFALASIPI